MRLPFRQSWQLRATEHELRRSAPRLAAMLAIFSRLYIRESVTSREQARRPGDWLRPVLAAVASAIGGLAAAVRWGAGREEDQAGPAASEQAAEAGQAERLAAEERIHARLGRHRDRDRGLRRLQPGPGRLLGGSPAISAAAPAVPELLDHEIQAITRVLNERGPTRRAEIARMAGARYWGPGVFRRALAEAIEDGLVRRVGRETYAVIGPGDVEPAETGR